MLDEDEIFVYIGACGPYGLYTFVSVYMELIQSRLVLTLLVYDKEEIRKVILCIKI